MLSKNLKVVTPLNGARAAIATLNNGTVQRTSVGFKLASSTYVRGDTGAGGLVAPLPRTACFGKFNSYIVWLCFATASVDLVHLYSYHSLA